MFCLLLGSDIPHIKFRSEIAEFLDFLSRVVYFSEHDYCSLQFDVLCMFISYSLFKDMLTEGWCEQEIENFITKVELVWGKLLYFIVCLRHILLRILGNFIINP